VQQFIQALDDFVVDHWIKFLTGGGFMLLGWLLGNWRARRRWRRKEFHDRLNVSLTSIEEGRLLIRTILEMSCQDVFLNQVATKTVLSAAIHTTPKDPTLPLPQADYWYYLNSVLNEISERFAVGTIRRDIGQPVTSARYLVALTCECAGELRTRKVRAMLVRLELLENLPEKMPEFDNPHHATRWDTLQCLASQRKLNPWKFIEVEICL